jgi:hypothetical protein
MLIVAGGLKLAATAAKPVPAGLAGLSWALQGLAHRCKTIRRTQGKAYLKIDNVSLTGTLSG